MFNPNDVVLDRVIDVVASSLKTGEIVMKLDQLEDVQLTSTTESTSVTDALGAEITKLYRAKKATLAGNASLLNTDLMAVQYAATKVVGTNAAKLKVPAEEVLTVASSKVTLAATPAGTIKYVYVLVNNGISKALTLAATTPAATEFSITGSTITFNAAITDGTSVYVEYEKVVENAVQITNSADNFPTALNLKVKVMFRDKCTDEQFAGYIIAPKAKIDPSSVQLSLKSDGKHPFTFDMLKDYCSTKAELFHFVFIG